MPQPITDLNYFRGRAPACFGVPQQTLPNRLLTQDQRPLSPRLNCTLKPVRTSAWRCAAVSATAGHERSSVKRRAPSCLRLPLETMLHSSIRSCSVRAVTPRLWPQRTQPAADSRHYILRIGRALLLLMLLRCSSRRRQPLFVLLREGASHHSESGSLRAKHTSYCGGKATWCLRAEGCQIVCACVCSSQLSQCRQAMLLVSQHVLWRPVTLSRPTFKTFTPGHRPTAGAEQGLQTVLSAMCQLTAYGTNPTGPLSIAPSPPSPDSVIAVWLPRLRAPPQGLKSPPPPFPVRKLPEAVRGLPSNFGGRPRSPAQFQLAKLTDA